MDKSPEEIQILINKFSALLELLEGLEEVEQQEDVSKDLQNKALPNSPELPEL
jgi:hypothetical protein